MKKLFHINVYANDIKLYDEFSIAPTNNENKEELVDDLLAELNEPTSQKLSYEQKRRSLRAKINTLMPNSFSTNSVNKLNNLLQIELKEKEINSSEVIYSKSEKVIENTKIAIWQGDITTLKIDAIVNAANNQMLGCFQPLHSCIDNVIHSAAGVQLRDDCNSIMQKQGFLEPTGTAKITRAYNLPSKFVIHTVGPIVYTEVSEQNEIDLANSYISCLEVSKNIERIKSIAFCCISTGVFGYPSQEAANVAYNTVLDWLSKNPNILDFVVFNVFSENDKYIYESLVGEND